MRWRRAYISLKSDEGWGGVVRGHTLLISGPGAHLVNLRRVVRGRVRGGGGHTLLLCVQEKYRPLVFMMFVRVVSAILLVIISHRASVPVALFPTQVFAMSYSVCVSGCVRAVTISYLMNLAWANLVGGGVGAFYNLPRPCQPGQPGKSGQSGPSGQPCMFGQPGQTIIKCF